MSDNGDATMASGEPSQYSAFPLDPMLATADVHNAESEGEGEVVGGGGADDSSEEEEDDSEEERAVAKGFIEDDDDEVDGEDERRRRKKRKHRHRQKKQRREERSEDGANSAADGLDEDDLDLVAENTGVRRPRTERRLRRAGSVASEDLDADTGGLANIFDDQEDDAYDGGATQSRRHDIDPDDIDDFIIEDEFPDDEAGGGRSRGKRKEKPKVSTAGRQKQAGRMMGSLAPDVSSLSREAWHEVMEVFGDGEDYAWALEDDNEVVDAMDIDGEPQSQTGKAPTRLRDIFEPAALAERMLTDADEAIRQLDVPERFQLLSTGLADSASSVALLTEEELDHGAEWIAPRISQTLTNEFLVKDQDGYVPPLNREFIQAVRDALKFYVCDFLEVPFVFQHRRDYFLHYGLVGIGTQNVYKTLIGREHLWEIYYQSFKFRALLDRKKGLRSLWQKLGSSRDEYFDQCYDECSSVDEATDLLQYLHTYYGPKLRQVHNSAGRHHDDLVGSGFNEDDGVGASGAVKYKKASKESRLDRAKRTLVSELAKHIGVAAKDLATDFVSRDRMHFQQEDPPKRPFEFAEEFVVPDSEFDDADKALDGAKLIASTEIGRDPQLKKYCRELFKAHGAVSVRPTDAGLIKIDDSHPFHSIKYLTHKPFHALKTSTQFLYCLKAEEDLLVTLTVHLQPSEEERFRKDLLDSYKSDMTSELAISWNDLREDVLKQAIDTILLVEGTRWARNYLRDEASKWLASKVGAEMDARICVSPYQAQGNDRGETPSVVAISHGPGDVRRTSAFVAYLDELGRFRDHMQVDNLRDETNQDKLSEFLHQRRPNVIVIGGFNASTHRLIGDVKQVVEKLSQRMTDESNEVESDQVSFPIITVRDDTARLFQHSKRAENEFGNLQATGKYCVALARYVQSPVNEFAALGNDMTAVSFHPDQQYLSKPMLHEVMDKTLVHAINTAGVDVNRAVHDSYYQYLLPWVCGLGPRKAQKVIKAINAMDGTIRLREQLVTKDMVTKNIFYNCASFLRISQDDVAATIEGSQVDPDPLDDTRIHPEDYHIARKMAADALELDEEDLTEQHPSQVVSDVMADEARKLNDLSLDDFAGELERMMGMKKRISLYGIRDELLEPFREMRPAFKPLDPTELFDMLTGESDVTLSKGLVLPVKVLRHKDRGILVRLDSGLEGQIDSSFMVDEGTPDMTKFPVGATIQAVVMEVRKDMFFVELNCQPSQLSAANDPSRHRRHVVDPYFDGVQMEKDREQNDVKRGRKGERVRRIIKHPNFHNFNAGQAEQHLANEARGECVIRPSSRGTDHLAVTWKVDEGVYQHIDVLELDKPNELSLGRTLKINRFNYSDLDELIHSHVRAMARKVEEMVSHEKYKGSKEDLSTFLGTSLMANPDKSVYGFAIDHGRPGSFTLGHRVKEYTMETWTVTVLPGAFDLNGTQTGDMTSLCNAFKMQYASRQAAGAGTLANAGNRTVYGRTPIVGESRTPRPTGYGGGGATPRTVAYGNATPRTASGQPGWDNPMVGGGGSVYGNAGAQGAPAPTTTTTGWGRGGGSSTYGMGMPSPAPPSAPPPVYGGSSYR